MKNLSIILGLLFITTVSADGHMQSEKDVLSALNKYFIASNAQDYATVISLTSKAGSLNTNSDGSFHKPNNIMTVEDWKKSDQGGVTNPFYVEATQISKDVVHVRFYSEGMVSSGGNASDYRTRVTMNWVKENGAWVIRSQHYSPAAYGGVHKTQQADFD
jgi:hypothetical protein